MENNIKLMVIYGDLVMNKEEFLKAIMELPKIETDNPISTMTSINVDDLMSAVDRFDKVPDYNNLLKENQELKKQVEQYQQELEKADSITQSCIFHGKKESEISYRKCLNALDKKETQQKEFIEYMNKTIEDCNNYSKYIEKKTKELHGRSCGKTYIANEIMKNEVAKKILKEILSKFKEIIGVSK